MVNTAIFITFCPALTAHKSIQILRLDGILARVRVLFYSTGSESSSYIIALCGVSFWWCSAPSKRGKWGVALLVFVFMISGFGSSDLYPPCIKRGLIQQYALKALPCLIVWLRLCYEMMVYDYKESPALSPQQHIPDDVLSH